MLRPHRPASLRLGLAATVAVGALVLSGCATNEPGSADVVSTEAPVTVDHAFGETTVAATPSRVVATSSANQDLAIALGIVPVGFPKADVGDDDADGLLPWTAAALEAAGATADKGPTLFDETKSEPYEAIANLAPDVILAAYSGLTREEYDTLSAIAPTVAFPELAVNTAWRDTATLDGAALGQADETAALIVDVEARIRAAAAAAPQIAGKTFAYASYDPATPGTIEYFTADDARVDLVEDFGLALAPSITALAPTDGSPSATLDGTESTTGLGGADVLFVAGDASTLSAMQADPALASVPAVARGSVVVIDPTSALGVGTTAASVLSIPWVADEFVALIAQAVAAASPAA